MQIDLTPEASAQDTDALHDRHRRWIITAAALLIGLAVGGGAGVTLGTRSAGSGQVALASTNLVATGDVVELHWTLANFSAKPARAMSVLVNAKPVALVSSEAPGKSITEFVTPLECGAADPPQFSISITDGGGEVQDLGYLVNKGDWERACN